MSKLSNQSLSVIECGYQNCHSGHTPGRLVSKDYSVAFILEGKGTYSVNGAVYNLNAGEGFLLYPNIPHVYAADTGEPWKYIYATFTGIDAPTLVHNAGLDENNGVFRFPANEEFLHNLKCMHAAGKDYLSKGYDILGYFMLVMSSIVKQHSISTQIDMCSDKYVKLARTYIEDHATYNISIKDIADYVKIERSYLYRLFVKHLGISPSKYLSDIRMKRAVDLLEYDALSVGEVAISAGFYDPSHFSRAFRNEFGMSPGKYRKTVLGVRVSSADTDA